MGFYFLDRGAYEVAQYSGAARAAAQLELEGLFRSQMDITHLIGSDSPRL